MTAYVPREGPPGPQGPPGAPGAGDLSSTMFTTKGDLLAATAPSTVTREGVGANDTVHTADSTQATGHKWVKVGDAMILAGSNLAKLAAVTGTPNGTKLLRDDGSWQNLLDNMVASGTNLRKLSAVTGTPDGTKFLRDDGSWQAPGGGGSITFPTPAVLGSDGTVSGATAWTDLLTLALTAGSWLVVAQGLTVMAAAGGGTMALRLWDGTTTFSTVDSPGTIAASTQWHGSLCAIFTAAASITLRLALWSTRANSVLKAAGINAPSGNNATQINAIKLA